MAKALNSAGHSLVAVQENLIDAIWEDRLARPSTQLIALGLKYTGSIHTHIRSSPKLLVCLSPGGWGLLEPIPGLIGWKAVNTLDSLSQS